MTDQILDLNSLEVADRRTFYLVATPVDGDLRECVTEIEVALDQARLAMPRAWYKTTGADINSYFGIKTLAEGFQNDGTYLLFDHRGMDILALSNFRKKHNDIWFSQIRTTRG